MSTTEWKLVPVEPTEEMARDGSAKIRDFFSQDGVYPRTKAMWAAMLAASPALASPADAMSTIKCVACDGTGIDLEEVNPVTLGPTDCLVCGARGVVPSPPSAAPADDVAGLASQLQYHCYNAENGICKVPRRTVYDALQALQHHVAALSRLQARLAEVEAERDFERGERRRVSDLCDETEHERAVAEAELAKVRQALPPFELHPVADGGGRWHYELRVQGGTCTANASAATMREALTTTRGNIRSLGPAGALDHVPMPYREWLALVEAALSENNHGH